MSSIQIPSVITKLLIFIHFVFYTIFCIFVTTLRRILRFVFNVCILHYIYIRLVMNIPIL